MDVGRKGGRGLSGSDQQHTPPFLSKTYDMVDDPATDDVISWGEQNKSFVVWSPTDLATDILPSYFKHNNFSSFVRQLNTYGFRKVDSDRYEFANEGFLRGQNNLLKGISRKKTSSTQSSQPSQPHPKPQKTSVGAGIDVVNEIEMLKRDKNVLMQELVGMRQQHQSINNQLQIIGKSLQGMEHRQQQMMAFMAKAMQSPGFFAQLVHQNDKNNRCISSDNKKRRFPYQDDRMEMERSGSSDGQIVKYQPLMNEAAKTMLNQILNMDISPMLERTNGSEALTSGNSSSRGSGVTLSEVPSITRIPYLPANSGIPSASYSGSSTIPKIQSPEGIQEMITADGLIDIPDNAALSAIPQTISPHQTNMVIPNLSPMQDMMPQDGDVHSFTSATLEDGYFDPLSVNIKEIIEPRDPDSFSPYADADTNTDNLCNEDNLPGIDDSFWEQLLTACPISEAPEAGYVDSTTQEGTKEIQTDEEKNWCQSQNMEYLTEQMGQLSSFF